MLVSSSKKCSTKLRAAVEDSQVLEGDFLNRDTSSSSLPHPWVCLWMPQDALRITTPRLKKTPVEDDKEPSRKPAHRIVRSQCHRSQLALWGRAGSLRSALDGSVSKPCASYPVGTVPPSLRTHWILAPVSGSCQGQAGRREVPPEKQMHAREGTGFELAPRCVHTQILP